MVHTDAIYITLNYKHTPHTKVAHTNYFISSLNIFIGKTPVSNFNIPFIHPSASRKPYYSSNLFLNGSIDPTSIGL